MQAILLVIQSSRVYSHTRNHFSSFIGAGAVNWPLLAFSRFILAFIVVAAHAVTHVPDSGPLNWIAKFDGFYAIQGFLLISGLSIGKSILKEADGYYWRRAQRIYPVYIISIALHFLYTNEPLTTGLFGILVINILFFNQLVVDTSYVGPAWTLSLEVWLYALAPFLLKQSYRKLLLFVSISLSAFIVYTAGRTVFGWPYFSGVSYGGNLLFLSYIWIAGFMLAVFPNKVKKTSALITFILLTVYGFNLAVSLSYRIKHFDTEAFGKDLVDLSFRAITILFIFFVVVCNRMVASFPGGVKKTFNLLGNISYPLYLTHLTLILWGKKFEGTNRPILVFGCLIAAFLIYWLFDFYSKKRRKD